MDRDEIREADYDIIENAKVAFRVVWKNAILIILISLIGALAAMIYVGVVGRVTNYAANATLFSAAYGSYEDSSSGVTVMNTYSSLIGTSRVCERAAEQLGEYGITSDVLKNMVKSGSIYVIGASSDSRSYSYRINVYVTSRSPERVVAITNAMADSLANELNDFLGTRTIQVMDEAESYYSYQSINLLTYMIMFAAVAFAMSCAVIFVFAFFSPWIRSVAQCEMDTDNVLGIIPYVKE